MVHFSEKGSIRVITWMEDNGLDSDLLQWGKSGGTPIELLYSS